MTPSLPRAGSFAAVTVAAGLAGASFHRAFGWDALAGPVAVAALVPVIAVAMLAGAARRRTVPLPLSVLAWVALWLGVVAVTLFRHGSPGVSGVLPAVGDALLHGWARLLEVTLPAPDSPDLLVVPQALTWLAAGAGAELVARTRTTLLPISGAVVVFASGVTLTVPGPGSNLPVAAGLIVTAGLLVLCRRAETRPSKPAGGHEGSRPVAPPRSAPGPAMVGLPLVVVIAGTALLVGPTLPLTHGKNPYDVRTHRSVALYPAAAVSPLDQVAAWLASPDMRLFTVRLSRAGDASGAAAKVTNIRLAVLDRFDGRSWTSPARFQPAGRRVPATTGEQKPTWEIRQEVEIDGLDGVLLPAMDRPVQLDGTGLAVDVDRGALLSTGQLRPGRRYTVVSAPRSTPDPAVLASLMPATGTDAEAALHLPPGLPDVLHTAAERASTGAITSFQQALALEQYLRTTFTNDPSAPPGHTYGHLNHFLAKSQTGTSEQFATVFAVAARTLGLPSRIVIGFSVPEGSQNVAVRSGDVLVWPEIDFADVGWLPFYPTPKASQPGDGQVASSAPGESLERAQRFGAAAALPVQDPPPPSAAPPPARHTRPLVYVALGSGSLAIATVLGYLAVALWSPVARRRRRRSARTPRERVVGAWHSAHEALACAGVAVPAASTPAETAQFLPAAVGTGGRASLGSLANLTTLALFAADGIGPAEADDAWLHEMQVRAGLRRAVTVRRRMLGRLAPSQILRPRKRR